MRIIKLLGLKISDFKGIKEFELNAEGKSITITGGNRQGKTTINDAYTWCLSDKDSQNKTDFEIKPKVNGAMVLMTVPTVEIKFDVDSEVCTLRKEHHEKWRTPRGSVEKVFDGYTNNYFVDGVEVKKKEYVKFTEELFEVDNDTMKLLSSTGAFTNLKWDEQYSIIAGVIGIPSDADMAVSGGFDDLLEAFSEKGFDNFRKVKQQEFTNLSKAVKDIPLKITAAKESLSETPATQADIDKLRASKSTIETEITELTKQIAKGDVNEAVDNIKRNIRNVESEMSAYESQINADYRSECQRIKDLASSHVSKINDQERVIRGLQSDVNVNEESIRSFENSIKFNQNRINTCSVERDELANRWKEANKSEFDRHAATCPTCGQGLPADQVDKLANDFNSCKVEKLKRFENQGADIKKEVSELEKVIEANNNEIKKLQNLVLEHRSSLSIEKEKLQELISSTTPGEPPQPVYSDNAEWKSKNAELLDLRTKLTKELSKDTEDKFEVSKQQLSDLKVKLGEVSKEIEDLVKELHHYTEVQKTIDDFKEEHEEKGKKLAEIKNVLFRCDEFVKYKMNYVDNKQSKYFKFCNFKLINELINGGTEPCCVITVDGVEFNSINHESKVNAQLEVLNVLSKYNQLQLPVFMDFAESVETGMLLKDNELQTIRLKMVEGAKLGAEKEV